MAYSGPWSAEEIEAQYEKWKADPQSVSEDWRHFFKGFELGLSREPAGEEGVCSEEVVRKQSKVEALIYRYRDIGHLLSCLDPLVSCPTSHPLLELAAFGLDKEDLDTAFYVPGHTDERTMPLREIIQWLKQTYCRSIGVEYMHLQDPDEREWLRDRMESTQNRPSFDEEEKRHILYKLCQAKRFEQFIHKKYLGQKRFSLEGGDALIPVLDKIIAHADDYDCSDVVMGMAHRGRLNVITNVLRRHYEDIFREFEDQYNPNAEVGAGDVKYHKGHNSEIETVGGGKIRVILPSNPAHLESVDPVVEGIARALQDSMGNGAQKRVLPLLMHGDAGFIGQGVVAETLNMSQLDGFSTGGTIHIVINNQIGYTTLPDDARSTRYATDIAKSLMIPIFHVHGEDPEAAVYVAELACDYRMKYGKDVVIDLVGYRQYGHNEGDEPYFTAPQMYDRIKERPSVDSLYADRLAEANVIDKEDYEQVNEEIDECLDKALKEAREKEPSKRPYLSVPQEKDGFAPLDERLSVKTGIDKEMLVWLAERIDAVPGSFHLHKKLQKQSQKRQKAIKEGEGFDWSFGEALAFGSIVYEGLPVRLSGEDSQRGTFSQRHSVLFDVETNEEYVPLNHISDGQGPFFSINSPLSEAGVLGFEYGYSLIQSRGLVLWEAQFGDFVNNAQAVIDLYIASGESKWQHISGLTLLLPHGYEGQGPEHSSARFERFLELGAEDNIQVVYPTTPAQYFHLLRRQALGPVLKPLFVMTPKSLLRHSLAASALTDFTDGGFSAVLDSQMSGKKPEKGIIVTGKVYYDLFKVIQEQERSDIALIRVEQLYPFPKDQLEEMMANYPSCKQWLWVQEEPENMGAWRYIDARFQKHFSMKLQYVGRPAASSPATGFHHLHVEEQQRIIDAALNDASD